MPSLARRRSRAIRQGFTLVEVAVVVVIVGVLAVLAIVGYRRYTARAHVAEATNVSSGIRAAQEAYRVEKGIYAAVSTDTSSFYPAAAPGKFVTQWGGSCTNCDGGDADGWKKLPMHPSEPVMFGYATVAGLGGASFSGVPPARMSAVAPPPPPAALAATDPYFVTVAWGDTDADGKPCIVTSYSFSNQLVIEAEGE